MDKIKFQSDNKRKGIVQNVIVEVGQKVVEGDLLALVINSEREKIKVIAKNDGIIGEIKIVESIIVKPGETMFEVLNDHELNRLIRKQNKLGNTLREGLEKFGHLGNDINEVVKEYDAADDNNDEFEDYSDDEVETANEFQPETDVETEFSAANSDLDIDENSNKTEDLSIADNNDEFEDYSDDEVETANEFQPETEPSFASVNAEDEEFTSVDEDVIIETEFEAIFESEADSPESVDSFSEESEIESPDSTDSTPVDDFETNSVVTQDEVEAAFAAVDTNSEPDDNAAEDYDLDLFVPQETPDFEATQNKLNSEIDMTWSNLDINIESIDEDGITDTEITDPKVIIEDSVEQNHDATPQPDFEPTPAPNKVEDEYKIDATPLFVNDSITKELSELNALSVDEAADLNEPELEPETEIEEEFTNELPAEVLNTQELTEMIDDSEFLSKFTNESSETEDSTESKPLDTVVPRDQAASSYVEPKLINEENSSFVTALGSENKINAEFFANENPEVVASIEFEETQPEVTSTEVDDLHQFTEFTDLKTADFEVEPSSEISEMHAELLLAEIRNLTERIEKLEQQECQIVKDYEAVQSHENSYLLEKIEEIQKTQKTLQEKVDNFKNTVSITAPEISSTDVNHFDLAADSEQAILEKIEKIDEQLAKLNQKILQTSTSTARQISSIDFEVDVTGLMNLHTLMHDPYLAKGVKLGLNTFYLKALHKVIAEFQEFDFNDNQTISLGKIKQGELLYKDINLAAESNLEQVALQIKNNEVTKTPNNIILVDMGKFNVLSSKLQLPNQAVIAITIGDVHSRVINHNLLSDYVNVSVAFDQSYISFKDAVNLTNAFNEIINNPGLLI
ncbi:hypothetical protein SCLARK_00595 [Spiroplasma clarkii]|uniref:Lipoyl-binding domain-containing protein n=1 Tax=Spiroplasma clarkii TaxID=2139 RepID=A0A1Y0KZU9_9MOLU|nr:hypothetical protein [Spiroplasma clarkii]ARU91266.1 hypothetical protein SCLARK_00595 [Spiroplasma clarkii]ATX70703.1 hypothetical protein SCLAR_v1c03730 [Spiroplasma clarkii]